MVQEGPQSEGFAFPSHGPYFHLGFGLTSIGLCWEVKPSLTHDILPGNLGPEEN